MNSKPFILMALSAFVMLTSCTRKTVPPAIPSDPAIERRIESVLSGLSLEDKVGQMVQITADPLYDRESGTLNDYARKCLREYRIGSVLNTITGCAETPEFYRAFIDSLQKEALAVNGIPILYGLDQIHGASYMSGATLFPQEIALAASFNENLPYQMGRVAAYETRAGGVSWVFTPTLDLSRNQCWPRMWESYGEDPLVQTRMGVQETLGLQGPDPNHVGAENVAVSIKHFMAYGAATSGQDRTPSSVSYRELKEKYFPPFKACIEAGALTLMVNSSINDGVPFHANKTLLTDWVKEGLNWDGMIVTDWADIRNIWERDHVAKTYKDAIALSINAGVDMIMEPYDVTVADTLRALALDGTVPMKRIDDAVRRILRVKFRLGLFDDPYTESQKYSRYGSDEFASIAYNAALESEVLLKNEGALLPLDKSSRILLLGPNADSMRPLGGGWNYTWQGERTDEERFTAGYNTIREALEKKFASVKYLPVLEYPRDRFTDYREEVRSDYAPAIKAAGDADAVVICIGENSYCETPGNLNDLNLSPNQRDLVKAVSKTGKPIVLILNEGRPRIISDIEPLASAVVSVLLPGNYGADALAALLCGEENFSAKLPYTYPKYPNKLNTYDYKLCENRAVMEGMYNYDASVDVQWPFGYGLSYTDFVYSSLRCDSQEFRPGDTIEVSVDVTNAGKVAGSTPVLLFVSDLYASVAPDVRRLRDFTKISLESGQTKTVTFRVKSDDLAFVDHDLQWKLEPGEFRFAVGSESLLLRCVK